MEKGKASRTKKEQKDNEPTKNELGVMDHAENGEEVMKESKSARKSQKKGRDRVKEKPFSFTNNYRGVWYLDSTSIPRRQEGGKEQT